MARSDVVLRLIGQPDRVATAPWCNYVIVKSSARDPMRRDVYARTHKVVDGKRVYAYLRTEGGG